MIAPTAYASAHLKKPRQEHPILDLIGNTPLIPLPFLASSWPAVRVYAKAEWYNPAGSVKDRAAANMIMEAFSRGAFDHGEVLLDATSGNTGVAYAMLGAALGIPVRLVVPESSSELKKNLMRAYGAGLVFSDAALSSDGAVLKARRLYEENPDKYVYLDQYSNPANWQAHYRTTAVEILRQTGWSITHFIAGLGTTGTFVGTGRRLKREKPGVELISVQPDFALHGIEGLKHLASAMVPPIYDDQLADHRHFVSTDESEKMQIRLARQHGLLVGLSSAAAAVAAQTWAGRIEKGTIVVIFPDGGINYLDEMQGTKVR